MKLKRLTHYMLEHRLQAVLLTFGFTFIPVAGVLGILYAALVTLRKGVVEGAVMTVAATLPYVFSFMLASHDPHASPIVLWTAVGVAVMSNVLTWVFAVMLYRQMTWSGIIQIAALVGVLIVSIVHLVYPDITGWWSAQLTSYYTQADSMMSGVLSHNSSGPTEAQLESIKLSKILRQRHDCWCSADECSVAANGWRAGGNQYCLHRARYAGNYTIFACHH